MDGFLNIIVANTLIATVLALVALSVTKVWRNPHLAHALWLLVLIKLVTPPIVTFPLEALHFADVPPAGTAEIVDVTLDDSSVTWPAPRGAPTAAVETFEPIELESTWAAAGSIAETDTAETDTAETDEDASTSIDQGEWNSDRVHAADDRSLLPSLSPPAISQQSFSSASIFEEGKKDPGISSEPVVGTFAEGVIDIDAEIEPAASSWLNAAFLHGPLVAFVVWIGGGLIYLCILVRGHIRFRQFLAAAGKADGQLLADAGRFAATLGLARCPVVRVIDARIPPLVWGGWFTPLILLPRELLARLDHVQRQAVLVHELAHVCRRDFLVRWLEVLVLVPFWWNPVAWWARRQIRQAEEECCDAWVVWALPDSRRSYGQALMQTIEFLGECHVLPAVAASTFGGFLFKRRIEMIMKRDVNRKMTWHTWAVVLLLGAVVLPVAAQTSGVDTTSEQQASEPAIPDAAETPESAFQKATAGAATAPVPESPDPVPAKPEPSAPNIAEAAGTDDAVIAPEKSLEARMRRLELLVQKLVESQKTPRSKSTEKAAQVRKAFREAMIARRMIIRRAAVSPDGKFAAILTVGKTTSDIEIFEAASGRIMSRTKLAERVAKLIFSDNRHLGVLLADGRVRVFEVPTGKELEFDASPSTEWPPSKIRYVPAKSRSAPAKPDRIRRESKGQRRLLELDVQAAALKLEAARDEQAATQKLYQTGGASISKLRQTQFAVQQARLDVERAKTLLGIHQQTPTATIDQQTSSYTGLVTATNSMGMELIWIPAGEFLMGSPEGEVDSKFRYDEKQVRVTLTKPFYLGKHEVTQGQWQAVMKTRPWQGDSNVEEGRDFPATFVSWEDATSFCRELTQQERSSGKLDRGWEYTLPTEAQWEFACRAGSTSRYSFGDDESQLRDYAWYDGNAKDIGQHYAGSSPVRFPEVLVRSAVTAFRPLFAYTNILINTRVFY